MTSPPSTFERVTGDPDRATSHGRGGGRIVRWVLVCVVTAVADGDVVDVHGMRILGFADPAVTANGEDTDSEASAKRDASAARVAAAARRLRPDVPAVATGLGSLTVDTATPYEAQLLRFRDRQLVAIDYIVFEGVDGDYTVSRQIVSGESDVAGERAAEPDRKARAGARTTAPARVRSVGVGQSPGVIG